MAVVLGVGHSCPTESMAVSRVPIAYSSHLLTAHSDTYWHEYSMYGFPRRYEGCVVWMLYGGLSLLPHLMMMIMMMMRKMNARTA
jgi:hypothetical protein